MRSAYPATLTYGNMQVLFSSSYDEMGLADGGLRRDNPWMYGLSPAPKVMENRKLDSIEVRAGGALVRKYVFSYNVTDPARNRIESAEYGGTSYSGRHVLTSITQVGADGTSQLPPMAFSYTDRRVQRRTNDTAYIGNPGNPARITWPYLAAVGSGYSGGNDTITFSYGQRPDTAESGIWSRQVVTTKTVNSGMGVTESYSYAYSTGTDPKPRYLGTAGTRSTGGSAR